LIAVEVITKAERRRVEGTLLNGFGARIVIIDEYRVDVIPKGHLQIMKHKDQRGAIGGVGMNRAKDNSNSATMQVGRCDGGGGEIGRVGTMMAKDNIDIATMQVGRSDVGGDAIMALTMDRPISEEEIEKLVELTEIYKAKAIDL